MSEEKHLTDVNTLGWRSKCAESRLKRYPMKIVLNGNSDAESKYDQIYINILCRLTHVAGDHQRVNVHSK